jgi:hypothetical protein
VLLLLLLLLLLLVALFGTRFSRAHDSGEEG